MTRLGNRMRKLENNIGAGEKRVIVRKVPYSMTSKDPEVRAILDGVTPPYVAGRDTVIFVQHFGGNIKPHLASALG
jgi:hypothetical protein